MDVGKYKVRAQTDHLTFEFISEGPKGSIPKIVVYQHMYENFYNLAFGDKNTSGEILGDLITTNNGDTDIVLFTVASTLFDFVSIMKELLYLLKVVLIHVIDCIGDI